MDAGTTRVHTLRMYGENDIFSAEPTLFFSAKEQI